MLEDVLSILFQDIRQKDHEMWLIFCSMEHTYEKVEEVYPTVQDLCGAYADAEGLKIALRAVCHDLCFAWKDMEEGDPEFVKIMVYSAPRGRNKDVPGNFYARWTPTLSRIFHIVNGGLLFENKKRNLQ